MEETDMTYKYHLAIRNVSANAHNSSAARIDPLRDGVSSFVALRAADENIGYSTHVGLSACCRPNPTVSMELHPIAILHSTVIYTRPKWFYR